MGMVIDGGHRRRATAAGLLVAALALAGCGGGEAAEEAIEQQVEEALASESVDVDVDLDEDGSGSISVSGEDGDAEITFDSDGTLPEGFPEVLVPDGATVTSSSTFEQGEGTMQMVVFTSSAALDEVKAFYEDALPAAGFEVEQTMDMDTQGSPGFLVLGTAEASSVSVSGAEQDGATMFTVSLIAE